MAWRLHNIEIRNFKFFGLTKCVDVEGKNVLLYGENGCGKSSLYWSLYTLFQTCLKDTGSDISKYFRADNDQNLLNRYVDETEPSYIKLTMKNSGLSDKILYLSEADQSLVATGDPDFRAAAEFSDFINYNRLTNMFNYMNTELNDLMPSVMKDMLPFISLQHKCQKLDGSTTNSCRASEWWSYLQELTRTVLWDSTLGTYIDSSEPLFVDFISRLVEFNNELEDALREIFILANNILQNEFKENIDLDFDYQPIEFTTSGFIPGKIIVKASVRKLTTGRQQVTHLRTYFNEACLSLIALAIRLAAFEKNALLLGGDEFRLLVIDDVLLSLDMRNRIKIIEKFLSYTQSYQLIVLTHDPSFYRIFKQEINERGENEDWLYREMYIDEVNYNGQVIPNPRIFKNEEYLEKAKSYLSLCEYTACALCLRKECERLYLTLLEKKDAKKWNYKFLEYETPELYACMSKFKTYIDDYRMSGVLSISYLNTFRRTVLNKAAHDDIDAPFFRSELLSCMQEIESLNKIKRIRLLEQSHIGSELFELALDNGVGKTAKVQFVFREYTSRYEYNGVKYHRNAQIMTKTICSFLGFTPTSCNPNTEYMLLDMIDGLCDDMGISKYPSLLIGDKVIRVSDSISIDDLVV